MGVCLVYLMLFYRILVLKDYHSHLTAVSSVLAGDWVTLVDVFITIGTSPACITHTAIATYSVL